jgi:hypothetical protein
MAITVTSEIMSIYRRRAHYAQIAGHAYAADLAALAGKMCEGDELAHDAGECTFMLLRDGQTLAHVQLIRPSSVA